MKNKNFNQFKKNFRVKKTTVWLVALVVVFGLMGPWTLGANKAEAASPLDFADFLPGLGDSVAGASFDYLSGKLGGGWTDIFNQKLKLQSFFKPAMGEYVDKMDDQYAKWAGVPGLFTQLVFDPQGAMKSLVYTPTEQEANASFQSGDYSGPARNAQQLIAFQAAQSGAQASYNKTKDDVEEATGSAVSNALSEDSEVGGNIAAQEAAFESGALYALVDPTDEDGGLFDTIKNIFFTGMDIVAPGSGTAARGLTGG